MHEARTRICAICGELFALKKYQPGHTRFCESCKTPTCPICGKRFKRRPCRSRVQVHCSAACAAMRPEGRQRFAQRNADRSKLKQAHRCQECGKPITRRGRRNRFCSNACFWASDAPIHKRVKMSGRKRGEPLIVDPPAPSPAEIEECCRAIRAEWSVEEKRARFRVDAELPFS